MKKRFIFVYCIFGKVLFGCSRKKPWFQEGVTRKTIGGQENHTREMVRTMFMRCILIREALVSPSVTLSDILGLTLLYCFADFPPNCFRHVEFLNALNFNRLARSLVNYLLRRAVIIRSPGAIPAMDNIFTIISGCIALICQIFTKKSRFFI